MALVIPPEIAKKIAADDHGNVSEKEVHECFENHCGHRCTDNRPEHQTKSGQPSLWIIAETNAGRCLKLSFVLEHGNVYLKSAYPANAKWKKLYADLA